MNQPSGNIQVSSVPKQPRNCSHLDGMDRGRSWQIVDVLLTYRCQICVTRLTVDTCITEQTRRLIESLDGQVACRSTLQTYGQCVLTRKVLVQKAPSPPLPCSRKGDSAALKGQRLFSIVDNISLSPLHWSCAAAPSTVAPSGQTSTYLSSSTRVTPENQSRQPAQHSFFF